MKIIVFGGTFDPIHNAHLNIVHHVLTNGICDQVLIIPAWIPPHKNIKKITPYEIRRQMIEASVNDCRNVFISDIEKENKDKSYTVKTLSVLRTMFQNDELILLIGADSLLQLHTWYRAEQLVDMCQILTYPRKDIVINRKDIEEHWSKKITDSLLDGILKNAPVSNISSTEIRRIVSEKGINLIQPMVHSKVFSLINDLKLYQS